MKQIYSLLGTCLLFLSVSAQTPAWLTDVSANVGLASTAPALRINAVDINGDDYPDLVTVEGVNARNLVHVYLNLQDTASADPTDRMFVEWTDSSRINAHPHPDSLNGRRTEIVTLGDVDNDGDVDAICGTWHWDPATMNFSDDRATVMLNDGSGRFSHVPNNGFDALGLVSIGGFSLLDFNLDGNLDVYVATFSDDHPNNSFRKDVMMVGNGDGTFYERPSPFDFNTVNFPMYGASATDWNNDGYPDIMTSAYCRSSGSLWKNLGGAAFQDVAAQVNYTSQLMLGDNGQELCQWGAYPCDFDNDGDVDVFHALVHGGLDSAEGRSTIAVNLGAANNYDLQWQMDRLVRGNPQSSHLGNMDAAWIDLNMDMLVDLVVTETEYVPATDRGYFYIQDSTHYFEDQTFNLGLMNYKPHSLEPVDFDLDGDHDIIMNDRDDGTQIRVLENEIGNQNQWVGVTLLAPAGANQNCIGARIVVYSGGVRQMRDVQAGYGHWGAQSPFLQLFGLAGESVIDSIQVYWPMSGLPVTTVYEPGVNQVHEIGLGGLTNVVAARPDKDVMLYPNPTASRVNLAGLGFSLEGYQVDVFDLSGQQVQALSTLGQARELSLDVSALPKGIYLVRITGGGEKYVKRLAVR